MTETLEIGLPDHPCGDQCGCEPWCGYVRVSAVMGREELISPELQMHEITVWAARNRKRIVKVIMDIDKSGRTFTKRRVAEAITDIQNDLYKGVALWKWSRWGRNMKDSLIHLSRVEEAGGAVAAATEDFDPETSMGRFTRDLILRLAELQSDQMSDGWKEVGAKRRRDGLPHTSRPYFGYWAPTRSDDANPARYLKGDKYVINPEEATELRSAYERYNAGMTHWALADEWNAKGLLNTQGQRWNGQNLGRMMDTGFAAGLLRRRSKPPKSDGSGPSNGRSIWCFDIWDKGSHDPIIDTPTWEAYRAKRDATADMVPRLRKAAHALSGLLYCGICDSRMVAAYSGKHKKHNWVCPRGRLKQHRFVSLSNRIAMTRVLAWVESKVGEYADVTVEAERMARSATAGVVVGILEAERDDLVAQRKRIADGVQAGAIETQDGAARALEVRVKLVGVEARLKIAKSALDGGGMLVQAFTTLRDEWPKLPPHDHRELLSHVLRRGVVTPFEPGTIAGLVCEPTFEE